MLDKITSLFYEIKLFKVLKNNGYIFAEKEQELPGHPEPTIAYRKYGDISQELHIEHINGVNHYKVYVSQKNIPLCQSKEIYRVDANLSINNNGSYALLVDLLKRKFTPIPQ